MSKLFDRIDHEWELSEIDKSEQLVSKELSGFALAYLDGKRRQVRGKDGTLKSVGQISEFERLRSRSRMKLLRTYDLMADLKRALGAFRACPHCRLGENGEHKCCNAHKKQVSSAMRAVKRAGEDNMPTRLAQGRYWGDDEAVLRELEDRGLNAWEQWYNKDKKEGIWPGTLAYTGTQEDLRKLKEEYGSLDYRGWLQMLLENEEITWAEYTKEKARLAL